MEKESQLWKSVSARESLFSLDPRSIGYGSIDTLSSIGGCFSFSECAVCGFGIHRYIGFTGSSLPFYYMKKR